MVPVLLFVLVVVVVVGFTILIVGLAGHDGKKKRGEC